MRRPTAQLHSHSPALAVARTFVAARRDARALPGFPGDPPTTLEAGYAIQEAAIDIWGDEIIGWKVGKIPDPLLDVLGQTRVIGPIFRQGLWAADSNHPTPVPVFVGGFAALEAEFVYEMTVSAPANKLDWTLEEVCALGGRMRMGVEMAGSPLAAINDLGPTVVAADFGNNNGLILSGPFADWGRQRDNHYVCEAFIDGVKVGDGSAASIPGGPLESVRFLLEHAARRGRPLKAGQLVSTGAATGIHDILPGQVGMVSFGGKDQIYCRTEPATPAPGAGA